VTRAWGLVNDQMRTQLFQIEQVLEYDNLMEWWDVWIADFSAEIGARGQRWANYAMTESLTIIQQGNLALIAEGKPTSQHTAMVMAQLGDFATKIKTMAAPTLPGIPLLPAPGGSKRDLGFSETSSTEHAEDDEAVKELPIPETEMPLDKDVPARALRHGHTHGHRHGHHH
jgi:hypothetical protein